MAEIIMPKMGDAMETGKIVAWLKKVGDTVAADDAIFEMETDKSNVEVPADAAGILHEIRFPEGSDVPVGAIVAVIGQGAPPAGVSTPGPAKAVPASATAAPTTAAPAAEASAKNGASSSSPVPSGEGPAASAPAPTKPAPVAVVAGGPFQPYGAATFVGALPEGLGGSASLVGEMLPVGSEKVRATPVARAMASANGLDIAQLSGTGPDGAVSKADVEAAIGKAKAAPAPVAAPAATVAAPETEVHEYNAMRRTIAKRLAESKSTIPHFYVTVEIDMENLLALREQVNATASETNPKVSINDCVIRAVAVALVENPLLNSRFDDNKRIVSKSINIGVAVSLADGLIVPVLRDVQTKSLRTIAREIKPLIDRARAGKLTPNDYTGGTFTISNLGSMADVENFAAIINPGEGAILAVSGTRAVAAVVNGEIVARRRMKVTISADHRVVDGSDGAKFLLSLKRILETPLDMLA